MRKVKILYLLDTLIEMAGSERNLLEIVTNLNRDRFEPLVICMRGENMVEQLRERNIEVININLGKIYSPAALLRAVEIFRIIRRRGISIVVTYHESSDYLGSLVARLAGVPVIISSRRDMGYKLQRRHILMYRFVNRFFDRILTVSDAVKRAVAQREHVLWHKLVRIYNGVDAAKFSMRTGRKTLRKELGIEPNRPVIGMLAALRQIKGHRYFLEAAAQIRRQYPTAYFLIVGWVVENDYYLELIEQTKRLGLEHNVIFTGGRQDTPDILALFDIAVFSSLNEGFSNAVLESMAAGKPVVATRSGGTAEAIVDGESGILVEPADAQGLATAISGLLENRTWARRLGINACARAREMFDIRRMVRELEGLYDSLLVEKGGGMPSPIGFDTVTRIVVRTIKQVMSAFIYYLGIVRVLRRILSGKNGVAILAYHRVADSPFVLSGMSIRIANFEQQIRYIARHYTPLSLQEAVGMIERREKIPKNAIVITFDDGYLDNYVNAFPILRQYGVPATIFLSARAIEERKLLWFDMLTESFRLTSLQSVFLEAYGLGTFFLNSARSRLHAAQKVVSYAKRFSLRERSDFVRYVLERLEVKEEDVETTGMMMSWEDVRTMHREGITFGSHGMNHVILTRLSDKEIRREIGDAKELIRKRTGVDTKLFAYPNGEAKDFNREVERHLHRHDYVTACTLIKGLNDCTSDRLALRRFCVTEGMESNAFGRFSRALFAVMLSGLLGS
jgi:glycosyltransferase involved in cell wall biosynthesis/peptidoglycan/xylan/chitin deacetylase (PgdA/CDA1 family)